MRDEVLYMLHRFPEHRKLILKAYDDNEEFKSLCHDFYVSAKTLTKYQHNTIKNLKAEVEYQRLFADLEKEIVGYLNSNASK